MSVRSGTCECGATVEREAAAGLFAAKLNGLPFMCDGCGERDETDRERLEQENRSRRRAQDTKLQVESCGLPRNLRSVDLDMLDRDGCDEAITAAGRWAAEGGGLVFTGPYGTGKTTIAAGGLRCRIETGRRGRWASTPLLMARLGSGFDTPQRNWAVDTLTGTAAALVLDDADKVRPTEYGAEQVFLAVDGAVTSGRPLLLTTNLSVGELAGKWPEPYGEAIASRLIGHCDVIAVTGADRRLGRAA